MCGGCTQNETGHQWLTAQAGWDVGVLCTIFSAFVYLHFSVVFFFFLKPSTYKMGTVSSTLQSCRGARGCGSQLGTPWSLTPAAPALPSGPKGSTVNRHSCLDVGPEVPASRPGSSVRRMPLAAAPSTPHGHRPPPGLTTTNCSNSQRRLNQTEERASHHTILTKDAWKASHMFLRAHLCF